MSFDLAAWYEPEPISLETADEKYAAFCSGEEIEEPAEVARFKNLLGEKYPGIDDVPEEELEDCPWTDSFNETSGACLMCLRWDKFEELYQPIIDLALSCGLLVYDPQNEVLYHPKLR